MDKASILLVDDKAVALEPLRDVLTDLGYQVEVATDDLKAVEKARSQAFNAILMDIKLSKLNDVEAYKAIKRHQPETALIMMTGYRRQTRDLVNQAIGKCAYTYLYKQFDMKKAVTLIAEARRDDNFKGGESPC
jgi:two-component system response regulator HydG